jgi:hypothetical protein
VELRYPDPVTRRFIAVSTILSTVMYGTIAHVVLPHMQATASASQGQNLPRFDFDTSVEVARMMGRVVRQVTMVAYTDAVWFLFVVTLAVILLIPLMCPMRRVASDETLHIVMD